MVLRFDAEPDAVFAAGGGTAGFPDASGGASFLSCPAGAGAGVPGLSATGAGAGAGAGFPGATGFADSPGGGEGAGLDAGEGAGFASGLFSGVAGAGTGAGFVGCFADGAGSGLAGVSAAFKSSATAGRARIATKTMTTFFMRLIGEIRYGMGGSYPFSAVKTSLSSNHAPKERTSVHRCHVFMNKACSPGDFVRKCLSSQSADSYCATPFQRINRPIIRRKPT